jgi:flagellar basal-body rod modification protein FlgD
METSGISSSNELGRDQFITLLVAQLQNQDPLEPVTNEDFVAQLAQFSSLEGIERLNASFSDVLALQNLTQGANLIGHTATYRDPVTNAETQGTIEAYRVDEGSIQVVINGQPVAIGLVTEVAESAAISQ